MTENNSTVIEIESTNVSDTIAFAKNCADNAQNGNIFTLQGPLGAGKSEFARGFIRHLMGEEIDVPSPTFTLVQTYETPKLLIWHFDLYRLEDANEIYEIGWEDAISDGVLLIEWSERLSHLLPKDRKEIIITPLSEESRKITLRTHGKIR